MSDLNRVIPKVIKFTQLDVRAQRPTRASAGAAGMDLFALEDIIIRTQERLLVPLGLKLEIPPGMFGHIVSRSSHAVHAGIHVGAGIIDSDYRGEISVLLFNLGLRDFRLRAGRAVAQLIFGDVAPIVFLHTSELSITDRGDGAYGSTDKKPID